MAGERHGHGMLCVNRTLGWVVNARDRPFCPQEGPDRSEGAAGLKAGLNGCGIPPPGTVRPAGSSSTASATPAAIRKLFTPLSALYTFS